tara:strand:+ start:93 stop:479 length:387 start_codon:yes stop_codon:yes gene_type:complete
MKLHHTKYKKNYAKFILDSIKPYEEDKPIKDDQKLDYLINVFKKESNFNNQRESFQTAFSYWLSGLPSIIDLPFYNGEIIELAVKMGSLDKNHTEQQAERIYNNYWNFMAYMVLDMKIKQDQTHILDI